MDVADFLNYPSYFDDDYEDDDDSGSHEVEEDLEHFMQEVEIAPDIADAYDVGDMTAFELWTDCASAVVDQTVKSVQSSVMIVFFLLLMHLLLPRRTSWRNSVVHLLIAGSGCSSMMRHFHRLHRVGLTSTFVLFVSLGWLLLMALRFIVRGRVRGFICSAVATVVLFLCDRVTDPATIHEVRGVQMIYLMKLISLTFDDYRPLATFEGITEYFAYVLLPANSIFGPWISLTQYRKWCQSDDRGFFFFITQLWSHFRSWGVALFFLLGSACFAEWIIPEATSSRWMIAYRSAISFRFSHYFACYLSESLMALGGFQDVMVTKPLKIELPRSLVDVVKHWNIPMRNWLREYVFLNVKHVGSVPLALFATYAASSLLHGFNFQLSAVLLSLAFFTYVEHELRRKLALHLDACIEARACRDCNHRYKASHLYVFLTNLAFGLLAMVNLAYLGDVFDSSSKAESGYDYLHTLTKWSQLKFTGHYIMTVCYGIQLLL